MFLVPPARANLQGALPKMAMWIRFAVCWLAAAAVAERCPASTIVIHCQARCAGLNATSVSSTNPSPEQLMARGSVAAPTAAEVEAQKSGRGGSPLVFAQLEEAKPRKDGSPSFPGTPSNANFSGQTVYSPVHKALSPDQLLGVLGPAAVMEWTAVSRASFSCVDGRQSRGGVYAYGGDLGELVLGLAVFEHMAGRQLDQAETTRLFTGWVARLRDAGAGFGACIDAAAAKQLGASVGASELDLVSPPEELLPSLMLRVAAPEFVGSDHLRWMLQYSQTYAVRRELVEHAIRAFYGALWNEYNPVRPALRLATVSGPRVERAVVHVRASHWCASEQGLMPSVPSRTRAGSVLVYSPDAVDARRDEFTRYLKHMSADLDVAEYGARLRALGDGQAHLTEKAVGGMMRSYSVLFK